MLSDYKANAGIDLFRICIFQKANSGILSWIPSWFLDIDREDLSAILAPQSIRWYFALGKLGSINC